MGCIARFAVARVRRGRAWIWRFPRRQSRHAVSQPRGEPVGRAALLGAPRSVATLVGPQAPVAAPSTAERVRLGRRPGDSRTPAVLASLTVEGALSPAGAEGACLLRAEHA